MTDNHFSVRFTADFYLEEGPPKFKDLGLDVWDDAPHIRHSRFASHEAEITSQQLQGASAAVVLTPRVTAESLVHHDDLLCISRFGVGYDSVDVTACTACDVLVTIAAGAVDRSMAEATIGWMIALTHQTLVKDRLVRTGGWHQRTNYNGCELRDRILGVIGLGGIGQELVTMLRGFGMQPPIACDPHVPDHVLRELGVQAVSLDELLSTADFVSVHCPLNDATRGLIGAPEFKLMKPDAYLINTARGGIVDEDALLDALNTGCIAGAALDCFAEEPVITPHPLGQLDNVILAPHSIAWTHEFFRDIGRTVCRSLLDLSLGRKPHGVLNPELLARDSFRHKWARLVGRSVDE